MEALAMVNFGNFALLEITGEGHWALVAVPVVRLLV